MLNMSGPFAYAIEKLHAASNKGPGWELCATGKKETIAKDLRTFTFSNDIFVPAVADDFDLPAGSRDYLSDVNRQLANINPRYFGAHQLSWYKPADRDDTGAISLKDALAEEGYGYRLSNVLPNKEFYIYQCGTTFCWVWLKSECSLANKIWCPDSINGLAGDCVDADVPCAMPSGT